MVMVATLAALSSVAGAQQAWKEDNGNGSFRFVGCYTGTQSVLCDLTYTLEKLDSATLKYGFNDVKVYNTDGTNGNARSVSLAGASFEPAGEVKVVKSIPTKITVELPLPAGTRTVRALLVGSRRFDNLTVNPGSSPNAAPPRPTTPPANVSSGQFDIQLSGCKEASGGGYTCTGAVVTPKR